MKKALITGIGGFVGNHLTRYLISKKINVFGIYHPDHPASNIENLSQKKELFPIDLAKSNEIKTLVKKINPNYVFHLAAVSSPSKSFENPGYTLENNIFCQVNLLDALAEINSVAKILIVGSGEEYGISQKPYVSETTPLAPVSPYAVSKVAQDLLGFFYNLHHQLNIVRVRPFNHTGPGQSTDFVVPAFASQIARVEKAGKGEIRTGNLENYRDFTDVRDIVKGYFLLLEKGKVSEVYNIGSGRALKIDKILKMLISFSKVRIKVKIDKSRFLPVDIKKVVCDNSKIKKDTGWKPTIPIAKTLFDTIEYERSKIR